MLKLANKPNLKDFQKYVSDMEIERGFDGQTTIEKCLLLGEEVGELFKAVRKSEGMSVEVNSNISEVGEELADVFIYLCEIANRNNVDLETAFRSKEEKNKKRTWK